MRLLKINDDGWVSLALFLPSKIPAYAILSHRWEDEEEVLFADFKYNTPVVKDKLGARKIRLCIQKARDDGLQYFWIDSCCIDRSSSAEISESITSMFRWYQNAVKCYVYLADVDISGQTVQETKDATSCLRASSWFTRGWTLQELLAPRLVEFYDRNGQYLADKAALEDEISQITRIPNSALRSTNLGQYSVEERMSWAADRETAREEDKAYCLLGIFNVYLVLNYGKQEHAFRRLKREIEASRSVGTSKSKVLDFRNLLMKFVSSNEEELLGQTLEELDQYLSSQWTIASRTALQALSESDRQLVAHYTLDKLQSQMRETANYFSPGASATFARSLNHLRVFVESWADNVASPTDISVFWRHVGLIAKIVAEKKLQPHLTQMLRRVFQKVEILNRYCVLSSTILTRVKEPCFEAILIITELNTYIVQAGKLARRHPQGVFDATLNSIFSSLNEKCTKALTELDDVIARVEKLSSPVDRVPGVEQLRKLLIEAGLL